MKLHAIRITWTVVDFTNKTVCSDLLRTDQKSNFSVAIFFDRIKDLLLVILLRLLNVYMKS